MVPYIFFLFLTNLGLKRKSFFCKTSIKTGNNSSGSCSMTTPNLQKTLDES